MSPEVSPRRDPDFADPDCRSFKFTAARVAAACRAVADGEVPVGADGRVQWRDADCPGLFLRASTSGGAAYMLLQKRDGRLVRKVIGSVIDVDLHEAREAVGRLRYDRTLAAQVTPRERPGRGSGPTIGEVFTAYIKAAEAGTFKLGRRKNVITDRTAQNYRDVFNATLQAHEGKSLDWLAANIVRMHRDMGLPSGSGETKVAGRPYQANRMLQTARNIFTYAASIGAWSKPNPCVDPATGGAIAKFQEHARDRILTDAEETRLVAELRKESDPWPDLFAIALLTGRRMSAVGSMRWADVDLGRGVWTVPRERMKGRKAAHGLVLDPDAVAILRRRRRQADDAAEWVFPARRSVGPVTSWKSAWKRIRTAAALDSKDRSRRVVPHDLRRSWGSRLVEAGVPTVTVNAALGNSPNSVSMTAKTYMHVPDTVQAEAVKAAYARRQARKKAAKRSRARSKAKG
ncbi:MAG: tyrosine-type recombinase/integrase [Planctomycetia bacterium]